MQAKKHDVRQRWRALGVIGLALATLASMSVVAAVSETGMVSAYQKVGTDELIINGGGGFAADGSDGIKFTVNTGYEVGADQVWYANRKNFLRQGVSVALSIGGRLFGQGGAADSISNSSTWDSVTISALTGTAVTSSANPSPAVELRGVEGVQRGSGSARVTYTATRNGRTYVMHRDMVYVYPNDYITETFTIELPANAETVKFYYGGDTAPGDDDNGFGIARDPDALGRYSVSSLNPDPEVGIQIGMRTVIPSAPNYVLFDGGNSEDFANRYPTIRSGGDIGFVLEEDEHDAGIYVQWNITTTSAAAETHTRAMETFVSRYTAALASWDYDRILVAEQGLLNMRLENTGFSPEAGLGFSMTLPAGLAVAASPSATTTCGGSTVVTAVASATSVTVSGASLPARTGPANSACLVSIPVTHSGLGTYTVNASNVYRTVGNLVNVVLPSDLRVVSSVGSRTPRSPMVTAIAPGDAELTVTVTLGDLGTGTLSRVEYSTDNGATWRTTGGTATTFTITTLSSDGTTPLVNGTEYPIRVRAVSSDGNGVSSLASLGTPSNVPPTPVVVLPPQLPALVNEPVMSSPAAPSTTTTEPSPTTTLPPETSIPAPVPTDAGALPELAPGVSQVLEDGATTPVEVFVRDSSELVMRSSDFQLVLTGECASGCTITTQADGREVLELEENGRARVTGEGFSPGTAVYVWLFSEPTLLGELTVAADGTFTGSVDLEGIAVGEHTLQVNGTSVDGKARTANLGVLVSPEEVPSPLPTELPATGSDATPLVWVLLLTAVGGALVWLTRRRGVVTND